MQFSTPKLFCQRNADSSGTSMVEFAVVLPLVSTLIFGIVQYGMIFNTRVTLKDIAATTARYATTSPAPSPDAIRNYAKGLVARWMTQTDLDEPSVDTDVVVNGVGGAKQVTLVYRLRTYFPVPGTDSNGRFVIRTSATMR